MPNQKEQNRQLIRSYLNALASGATGDDLARFFTPDAVQIEFPNRLNANGGRSDLATLLLRAQQGQKMLSQQSYDIQSETVEDSRVAVEVVWTGTLAVAIGTLAAGSIMKAHIAIHFEIRDGRIAVQRNYDCFDPW
ncbi:MAG: nuclear transport factor 2 family protein [Caldilineales bacterium]|nr:nuclear transport factor 2 family protein [Caldilineales bacterium]MCW5859105.1 nuclear transport factor 2 family protein [Caldilineales bacterium]